MYRPIYERLPETGYQDNEPSDWLTLWVDELLVAKATQLENIWQKLDPVSTDIEWLDYLAYLVGLSGVYWDTKWLPVVKRNMVLRANEFWQNKGTLRTIREILNIHSLAYTVWVAGSLRVPFTVPSAVGSSDLRLYIRLPLSYARNASEFRETSRTLRNYAPALVSTKAVYEYFYAGYSLADDPAF
jgi:phage tail-like protein